jgi:hypothetical protein
VPGSIFGIGKLLSDTDTATEPAADRTPDRFQPDPYITESAESRGHVAKWQRFAHAKAA